MNKTLIVRQTVILTIIKKFYVHERDPPTKTTKQNYPRVLCTCMEMSTAD